MFTVSKTQGIATDKAAHFGVSFTLQTMFYGLTKKVLRLDRNRHGNKVPVTTSDRLKANLIAAFPVAMIGIMKEYVDLNGCRKNECRLDAGDLLADGLGIVTFIGFSFAFDF